MNGLVGSSRTVFGNGGCHVRKGTETDDIAHYTGGHTLVKTAGNATRAGAAPLVASGGCQCHIGIVAGDEVVVVAADNSSQGMLGFEVGRHMVVGNGTERTVLIDFTNNAAKGVVYTERARNLARLDGR